MLKTFFYIISAALLLVSGAVAAYAWLVVVNPGESISRENIERILAIESPVYYRDGVRMIGVFFEQAHRRDVPFAQIPTYFVHAIVAAEDHNFFDHFGVDFRGVTRAALANIRAGRVVQGGSTITQQTAKNLFDRRGRYLASKIRELVYALRLEYHYEKHEILEFYVNQFFVSGNGRGLGMAARYFFDKPATELSLLESAFIAGSVRGPNNYNPFISRTEEGAALARERIRQRTDHVLRQMYRLNFIDEAQLLANLKQEVPFRRGQMRFAPNTILDLVREGLAAPEVERALSLYGIDNVATSGIRIITSVDGDLQDQALFALRKELSRLDIRLQGYNHRAMQAIYADLPAERHVVLRPGDFTLAQVKAISTGADADAGGERVTVTPVWGPGGSAVGRVLAPEAIIDRPGLFNLLQPLAQYRGQAWSVPDGAGLNRLMTELQINDLVYVSVREIAPTGELLLDLEKYPELQGGVLALQGGAIRAMVGGMDNRHFNRAITARRPMGSAMKTLLYAAALQLGWNSADSLDNRRQVFIYQGMAFFPRPFGEIEHDWVSLSWAGVNSENLASIWLLYHLTDQLPPARFVELVEGLGLGRGPEESLAEYTRRIRDHLGVVVDRNVLNRTAFERAVALVKPDLLFAGLTEEYELLTRLHHGADFVRFKQETSAVALRERRERLTILNHNYLRYLALRDSLRALANGVPDFAESRLGRLYRTNDGSAYIYSREGIKPDRSLITPAKLRNLLPKDEADRAYFWSQVWLEGDFRVATVDLLEEAVEAEFSRLVALPPYTPEVLYQTRDFRVLVALHYLVRLSRALGVESHLDPVLSFPFGSNVITLLELARVYEAMRDGQLHLKGAEVDAGGLAIIERIESRTGKLIYAASRNSQRIFTPQVALSISDILFNAMEHGTGRSAHDRVRLHDNDPSRQKLLNAMGLRVPLFGKTGTANRFINAAFVGHLPGPANSRAFSLNSGYTVAAYVGFDDNRPMVRGSTQITGGSGALPIWARLATAVYAQGDHAAALDLDDLAFGGARRVPIAHPALGQVQIPIEGGKGGVVSTTAVMQKKPESTARIMTFGRFLTNGDFEPDRFFQPYWQEGESN